MERFFTIILTFGRFFSTTVSKYDLYSEQREYLNRWEGKRFLAAAPSAAGITAAAPSSVRSILIAKPRKRDGADSHLQPRTAGSQYELLRHVQTAGGRHRAATSGHGPRLSRFSGGHTHSRTTPAAPRGAEPLPDVALRANPRTFTITSTSSRAERRRGGGRGSLPWGIELIRPPMGRPRCRSSLSARPSGSAPRSSQPSPGAMRRPHLLGRRLGSPRVQPSLSTALELLRRPLPLLLSDPGRTHRAGRQIRACA